MEYRDLIKDQIDQFARTIGQITANFLKLKTTTNTTQAIETVNQQINKHLNININKLISLNTNETQQYLKKQKIQIQQFDSLSKYLQEIGQNEILKNKKEAKKYLKKAKQLINLANIKTQTISFEQINRKTKIEKLLST